jgi:hypothetical protein
MEQIPQKRLIVSFRGQLGGPQRSSPGGFSMDILGTVG